MFELTEDFIGGGLIGEVTVAPATLVAVFGKPGEADDYKVSGEYSFKNALTGEAFRIYDWKSTNLYDDPTDPSPEVFWASREPYEFHIGGLASQVTLASIRSALESEAFECLAAPESTPPLLESVCERHMFQRIFWNKG